MQAKQRIKIFLNNGYVYKGELVDSIAEGFLSIVDEHDNKIRSFSKTNILSVENLGEFQ